MNSEESSLFFRTFNIKSFIGSGSFGVVYEVEKIQFGDNLDVIKFCDSGKPEPIYEKTFAVKIIPQGLVSEGGYNATLCHPHILSCYNLWPEEDSSNRLGSLKEVAELLANKNNLTSSQREETEIPSVHPHGPALNPNFLLMQFELCTEGSLSAYLVKSRPFAVHNDPYRYYPETQNLFSQLLDALVYMEFKNVVHGDLKPDNILVTRARNGAIVAKITDFGLASTQVEFEAIQDLIEQQPGAVDTLDTVQGRRFYKCPVQSRTALLAKKQYEVTGSSHKGDMYSFGLIFMQMLIQFKSKTEIASAVYDAMQPENSRVYPQQLSENFRDREFEWIKRMLTYDIEMRPSASEVKEWTVGYKINNGLPASRQKFLNASIMFRNTLSTVKSGNGSLKNGLERRLHRYLVELLHEALLVLPPDDDIIVEMLRILKDCLDLHNGFDSLDLLYIYEKFVPAFEAKNGIENILTLEWLFAMAQCQKEQDLKTLLILKRISQSQTYKELDELNLFKLSVQVFCFVTRCQKYDSEVSDRTDCVEFKPKEFKPALQKARKLYSTLTEVLKFDPLEHGAAMHMFLVQTKLMVKLGQQEEAVTMFQSILKLKDESEMAKTQFYFTIMEDCCELFSFRNVNVPAIELMTKLYLMHHKAGNEYGRRHCLWKLAVYSGKLKNDGSLNEDELLAWNGVTGLLKLNHRTMRAPVPSNLLVVDPNQLVV